MGFPTGLDESVRVKIDFTITFDDQDINFNDNLRTIRSTAESKLSRMSAEELRNKLLFESTADFYYTDNNGVETKI